MALGVQGQRGRALDAPLLGNATYAHKVVAVE